MRKVSRIVAMFATLATAGVLVSAQPAAAATATTTTLTSSVNPSTVGQAVTLTATVGGAAPTGSVTFAESSITLGSAQLSGGVASLVVSSWSAGTHAVTATYSADSDNDASVGSLNQTVVAATPPPAPPKAKHVKQPSVELRASADKV